MARTLRRRGGFQHHPSDEKLREYARLTPKQKLEWLEEINRFLYRALPPDRKEIAQKFRRGEL